MWALQLRSSNLEERKEGTVSRILKSAVIGLFVVSSLHAVSGWGQQVPDLTAAPIPPQIANAKRVFISNAGEETNFRLPKDAWYSGGPNRTYNQFYAAMETWGKYEFVGNPGEADVVIEILFAVPKIDQRVVRGEPVLLPIPYDPQFRVVIRDPKTNALLWAFTEHAEWAELQRNRDKNFDQALAKSVSDIQGLGATAGNTNKP